MLKMTKIELENINDPDKYIFIEKEMREVVLVTLIKDTTKKITNITQIMIVKNLKHILLTLTLIIYMDMQRVNIYHRLVLIIKTIH